MEQEKCFCHFNGYQVKDAVARKDIEELKTFFVTTSSDIYFEIVKEIYNAGYIKENVSYSFIVNKIYYFRFIHAYNGNYEINFTHLPDNTRYKLYTATDHNSLIQLSKINDISSLICEEVAYIHKVAEHEHYFQVRNDSTINIDNGLYIAKVSAYTSTPQVVVTHNDTFTYELKYKSSPVANEEIVLLSLMKNGAYYQAYIDKDTVVNLYPILKF